MDDAAVLVRERLIPDTTALRPFPPFPVELVRCFVEVAAEGDRATSLNLCWVSTSFNAWTIPIIYHTVSLTHSHQVQLFHAILQGPSAAVTMSYVHCLCIAARDSSPALIISEIVSACTKLETLLSVNDFLYPSFMDVIVVGPSCPAPRHIVLGNHPCSTNPFHPLFRATTNLYIEDARLGHVRELHWRPCLTHLAFACWGGLEDSRYSRLINVALSSLSLVVLLLHSFDDHDTPTDVLTGDLWRELAGIDDKRLFAGPGLRWDDYMRVVESGSTIWDDAEIRYKDWRKSVV